MDDNSKIFLLGGGLLAIGYLFTGYQSKQTAKDLESADISNILQWAETVKQILRSYSGIEQSTILAMIWQESSGRVDPPHTAGEYGLMGLKPVAFEEMGEDPTIAPHKNIEVGIRFFSKIKRLTGGDLEKALRAYKSVGTNIAGLTFGKGSAYASKVLAKKKVIESRLNSGNPVIDYVTGTAESIGDTLGGWYDGIFGK